MADVGTPQTMPFASEPPNDAPSFQLSEEEIERMKRSMEENRKLVAQQHEERVAHYKAEEERRAQEPKFAIPVG